METTSLMIVRMYEAEKTLLVTVRPKLVNKRSGESV